MVIYLTFVLFNSILTTKEAGDELKHMLKVSVYTINDAFKVDEYDSGVFYLTPTIDGIGKNIYIYKSKYINMNCSICDKELKNTMFYALYITDKLILNCFECYNTADEGFIYENVFYDFFDKNLIVIMPSNILLSRSVIRIMLEYSNKVICNKLIHFEYLSYNNNKTNIIKSYNANHIVLPDDIKNEYFYSEGLFFLYKILSNDINMKKSFLKYEKKMCSFINIDDENLKRISKTNKKISSIKLKIKNKKHCLSKFANIINLNIDTYNILRILKNVDEKGIISGLSFYQEKNDLIVQYISTSASRECSSLYGLVNNGSKSVILYFLILIIILENEENKLKINNYNNDISLIYTYLFYRAKIPKFEYFYCNKNIQSLKVDDKILSLIIKHSHMLIAILLEEKDKYNSY